jgi:hypothetical protein
MNFSLLTQSGKPQRAHVAIRAKFASMDNRSFTEILKRIRTGDAELRARLMEVLRKKDSEASLLEACIALVCNQWSRSAAYSGRALELLPDEPGPDDPSGEISYVHACAIRYELAASPVGDEAMLREVHRAVAILDGAETDCTINGDTFGVARALTERCALRLMSMYYRWLSELATPEQELLGLRTFSHDFVRATNLISDLNASSPKLADPLHGLLIQREAICISAWVFVHLLAPRTPEARELKADQWPEPWDAVERYRAMAVGEFRTLIMQAECEMALLGSGHADPDVTRAKLKRIAIQALTDETVLAMDHAEIGRFVQIAGSWSPITPATRVSVRDFVV